MEEIRDKIRGWYLANKRPLPWRKTRDPYRIWVSEIILQQTRVNQGMDYYHNFLEQFPNIGSLALAEEAEVLKVWEGLGYYSRARNMHAAAKYIYYDRKGVFPETYADILELKGVGPYTASAISSIVYNEPRAVVDGNVHRVLSRLFGIEELPKGYRANSKIVEMASELIDREDPGLFNQAVMELGALVCTPGKPACQACPLKDFCFACREKRTEKLPLKARPAVRKKRYFNYLHIQDGEGLWLRKRLEKDIWEGLYEFPLIETPGPISADKLYRSSAWSNIAGSHFKVIKTSGPVRHILSHQEIHAKFYQIHAELDNSSFTRGYEQISRDELTRYPVHKLIQNYLNKFYEKT